MQRGSARNRKLDRWLGLPLLQLARLTRRKHSLPPPASVRRVGILTSTTLGDTLLSSAAIQDLQSLWPQAELLFFAAPQNRAAAELLPAIKKVVAFRLTRPWTGIAALRRERLDIVVDFSGWQRVTALLAARSGARFTAGFRRSGQHRHSAYDLAVEHRGDRHETANFAAMVSALGATPTHALALRGDVWSTPLDPAFTNAIVFHCWATGTEHALREWPDENWLSLAQRLRELFASKVPTPHFVLTGGPSDLDRSRALAAKLQLAGSSAIVFDSPPGSSSHAGLASVAALLRSASLVVSVNTGTMHLAAIAGAPTISINGPNSGARWGARGPRAINVEAPGPGCGYLDLGWEWNRDPSRHGQPSCMARTTVDQVIAAAEKLLAAKTS
jgi:heptosyltransferase-3